MTKADAESKRITLNIPEQLKGTDAAKMLVLAEITSDELMKKAYDRAFHTGGSSLYKEFQDFAGSGRSTFIENTLTNDDRMNMHMSRLFLLLKAFKRAQPKPSMDRLSLQVLRLVLLWVHLLLVL